MGEAALPQLSDEQIELLFTICKAASTSIRPPFAALSKAYDAEFERHGLNTSRDNAIFRWVMRLGELARQRDFLHGANDYSQLLRNVLQAQGITLIDQTSVLSESDHEFDLDQTQLDKMEAGAIAHDRRTLLRQSIDALQTALESRKLEKERLDYLEMLSRDAQQRRNGSMLGRVIFHWKQSLDGHVQNSAAAADICQRRLLHALLWRWNEAARTRVVADIVDNRVVVDMFYRWLMLARLRMFERRHNARLLLDVTSALRSYARDRQVSQAALKDADSAFVASRRDKLLRVGMQNLHVALRKQEDAERVAMEAINARVLPKTLSVLKARHNHDLRLERMADDCRFWYLTTNTLKMWRKKCKEQRHQKMVDRYAQLRAKVKTRMARNCLLRLRTKALEIHSMEEESNHRAQARIFRVGTEGFDAWHSRSSQLMIFRDRATIVHQRNLKRSMLTALVKQHTELSVKEQQALQFRQESNLACAAGALKKMQWDAFTSRRQAESAEALRARNEKQRMKQILKYLVAQTLVRRTTSMGLAEGPKELPLGAQGDPESPSLRPANRLATRFAESTVVSHVPPLGTAQATTPAYLQTPARSRRVVRFRPLPTPAPFTPFRLPGHED